MIIGKPRDADDHVQWLLEQGERVLDGLQEAEEAELPKVCCYCAVFADLSVCRSGNGT